MDKYHKGSSESRRKRSRSRSPIKSDKRDDKYSYSASRHDRYHGREDYKRRSSSTSSSDDDERHRKSKVAPPPPPKISLSLNKSNNTGKPGGGIQIKLNTQPAKPAPVIQKSTKISNVFGDDDSEPEEMPMECKMRMRNIGKDTPTSSGPNSFGKTKQGFIDTKKIFERKLKQMAEEISND